jgi:hypothetical protein
MNISRLMPFLSLLLLSNAALIFPSQPHLNPSDLCPLIDILDHELCGEASSSPLCALLHKYNTSFCSSHGQGQGHGQGHAMSNDAMSVRVLHNEYYANANANANANASVNANKNQTNAKDIHKVCPIINFIEQELCSPAVEFEFDPKELCPLLNLTYTEFCS